MHGSHKRDFMIYILLGAILVLIVLEALMATVPPVSRDALTHHLAIPKIYQARGGIVELPDIPFSYYPMNLDLLYLGAMTLVNDIAPKYVHFFFGLLTGGLLYRYLLPRFGSAYGFLGVLLWLSTPIVVRLSSEVYVDLGLGFFSLASVYSIIRWVETGFRRRCLISAGIFCGLALGTKYNALLVLAILSLMIPFIFSRLSYMPEKSTYPEQQETSPDHHHRFSDRNRVHPSIHALMSAIIFVVTALVVFSPWMIRNSVLKGNPIYPMFHSIFNAGNGDQDNQSRTATQETLSTLKIRRLVFKESFGEIALLPVRIFWEGQDDDPRRFDGKLNPWLLVFGMAAFLPILVERRSLKIEGWIWFVFSVLFLIIAFLTAPIRIRYLIPILPAVVVLAVTGIYKVSQIAEIQSGTRFRRLLIRGLLTVSVLAMVGYNGRYIAERFGKVAPLSYLSGQVSRDEYIAQRRPEYPLIQYVNRNLPTDARLLCIFVGQRRYYFDRDINFDEGLLLRAVEKGRQPLGVFKYLHTRRISHLFVRLDLFQNWLVQNLNEDQRRDFVAFWQAHIREIRTLNGFALFQLYE